MLAAWHQFAVSAFKLLVRAGRDSFGINAYWQRDGEDGSFASLTLHINRSLVQSNYALRYRQSQTDICTVKSVAMPATLKWVE